MLTAKGLFVSRFKIVTLCHKIRGMRVLSELKSHNWMFVQQKIYLKVSPKRFQEILENSGVEKWAYIFHDKDEGVEPHFHVILHYKNASRVSTIANLFKDDEERVQRWDARWNNACGYLIHITKNSAEDGRYPYDISEVAANFDYAEKINQIRERVSGSKNIAKVIEQYGNHEITRQELEIKLGDAELAKNHVWISRIEDLNAKREHEKFLKEFEGKAQETIWLWGSAGVGKSRYADYLTRNNETAKLGSSRDYFQDYHGENYVILNDLRPDEFSFADLLRITDPYQHDKSAPRRYHDLKLNLKMLVITTPYSPEDFYDYCKVKSYKIDTFEQLSRRIHAIHITPEFMKQVMPEEFQDNEWLGFD